MTKYSNNPQHRQVLQTEKQKKLRYYSHLQSNGDIIQIIFEGRVDGRSRHSRFNNIAQWTGLEGTQRAALERRQTVTIGVSLHDKPLDQKKIFQGIQVPRYVGKNICSI